MSVFISDITRKINLINQYKNDIKNAIKEKGVDVADTDTFASYDDKIAAIEQNLEGEIPIDEFLHGNYPVTVTYTGALLRSYAFYSASCSYVKMPKLTSIVSSTFKYCTLVSGEFPVVSYIGTDGFASCSKLKTISIPNCATIGGYCFQKCQVLGSISIPLVDNVTYYEFRSCYSLSSVYLRDCKSLNSYAFASCYNLLSFTIASNSVCELKNSNVFVSTPIAGHWDTMYAYKIYGQYGSIYVPMSLVDQYKSATNWIYFSSRIVGY